CSGILLGLPSLELLEQGFLVGVRGQFSRRRILLQKLVESVARNGLDPMPIKPLLGGREALPVRKRSGQRNLFPFRMKGRILEAGKFREKSVHELSELSIAVGVGRTVKGRKHRRDRNGVNLFLI